MMTLLIIGFASVVVPQQAVAQGTANVTIVNFSFRPSSIVVVIGMNNSVMWTNNDYTTHTVTADDNSYLSPNISSGGTFDHTFTVAGTYTYHCSIHPYMKGTIIVKNAGAPSSSTTTTKTSASSSSSTSTHSPSTSSSSTSSSSSYSTRSSGVTTSASPTTSSSAGGVPEFPYQAAAVTVVTLLLLASYIIARRTRRPRNSQL